MVNLHKKRSLILNLLRSGFAFCIIFYLLNKYLFKEVIFSISSSNLIFISAACVLSIFFQILVSYRLKLLANWQGISVSIPKVFKINLTAAFYGLFLPAKNVTGGAIRFYELSKENNKKAGALAAIYVDRIFATFALCTVGILFWLIDWPNDTDIFIISLVVFLATLFLLIIISSPNILYILLKIFELANLRFINRILYKFYESIRKYQKISMKALASIFILSLCVHFLELIIYYLLAMSLDIDISVIALGWVRSLVILATMIPITISGLGVREGVLIILLKQFGVAGEDAFVLSIFVFLVTIFLVGLIGGFLEIAKIRFMIGKWKNV